MTGMRSLKYALFRHSRRRESRRTNAELDSGSSSLSENVFQYRFS